MLLICDFLMGLLTHNSCLATSGKELGYNLVGKVCVVAEADFLFFYKNQRISHFAPLFLNEHLKN